METKHPYKNTSLTDIPNEKWRDIPNYDGIYLISNMGRIKIYPRQKRGRNSTYTTKEKIKKQYIVESQTTKNSKPSRCLRVELTDENSISDNLYVSNIVGLVFLGKKKKRGEVYSHINKIWWDNRDSNIEVISVKEAVKKEQAMGLKKTYTGLRKKNGGYIYNYPKETDLYKNKKTGKIYTLKMILSDFDSVERGVLAVATTCP